ncbi:hypothetical protein [Streptomyces lutosisoli]|uniref:Uncharacterized protein n=1 Tax=Streptomyces lutosisoli TaxID=2665721 RepID=A0ABW2VD09_9ACTN
MGSDPDDPARMMARKIMDGGRRSHVLRFPGQALDRPQLRMRAAEQQAVVK